MRRWYTGGYTGRCTRGGYPCSTRTQPRPRHSRGRGGYTLDLGITYLGLGYTRHRLTEDKSQITSKVRQVLANLTSSTRLRLVSDSVYLVLDSAMASSRTQYTRTDRGRGRVRGRDQYTDRGRGQGPRPRSVPVLGPSACRPRVLGLVDRERILTSTRYLTSSRSYTHPSKPGGYPWLIVWIMKQTSRRRVWSIYI